MRVVIRVFTYAPPTAVERAFSLPHRSAIGRMAFKISSLGYAGSPGIAISITEMVDEETSQA